MRVLMLAPMLQSGAGKVIVGLARDLPAHGIECSVASSGSGAAMRDWPDYSSALERARVPHFEINFFDRAPEVFWDGVRRLRDHLSKNRYDLLHAHSGVPAAAAHCALDLLGSALPVVVTFHSWGLNRPAWMDAHDLHAFRRCREVVVVSTYYREFVIARGMPARKVAVIHNGVGPELLHRPRDRQALLRATGWEDDGSTVLASLGVIEPRKNQEAAVEALSLLAGRRLRLALMGGIKDADYKSRIEAVADHLGVRDRVCLTGYLEDPLAALSGADLFVFTSRSEGQGIAVIEAMALGLPVLAGPVEGAADMVRDGRTALAIDPGDPKQIADRIRTALDNPPLCARLVEGAREMVAQEFLWPTTVGKTASLYASVLSHPDSGSGARRIKRCGHSADKSTEA